MSSTGALSLSKVPNKMIVIGGGVIGLELGSVWSRLGAHVTVVEFQNAIGGGMDAEIAKSFQKILAKQGLHFKLATKVLSAKKNGDIVQVVVQDVKSGKEETMDVDVVLVSIGRKPYTANLGLESVGVKMDAKGRVVTDAEFKTNIPSIRAIGDVIAGLTC